MKNKKGQIGGALIALIIIIVVIIIIVLVCVGIYNGLVGKDVAVKTQWGNVQTAYQRRMDLIPNLVATVKGSAAFEESTQTQIAALRSKINTAQTPSDMQAVDTGTSSLIHDINVQVEAYPTLQSTANFRALQDEIAGTENRINWERDNYNTVVQDYQTATRMFPGAIFAGMFGFSPDKYTFFQANENASTAPVVNFSTG